MAGRALGALLVVAVAALLAASAARAADDDDKKQPWKCFRSCARGCYHHHDNYSATVPDFPPSGDANVSAVSTVTGECKNGCHEDECFKDLPAISHTQCAMATCLSHPHHSKKTACLKDCCDKCFRNSPPAPGPPKPSPPEPSPPAPPGPPEPPGPPTPGPEPKPPSPPN